jgi:hypothetical protein
MHRISYAVDFWSKSKVQAMFLLHEGYLGSLGAFLQFSPSSIAKPNSPRPIPTTQTPEKGMNWFQRILQNSPLSFDFNLRTQPQTSDKECECGCDFCEGIVCKQDNGHHNGHHNGTAHANNNGNGHSGDHSSHNRSLSNS